RLFQIGRATGDLAPDTSWLQVQPSNLIFSCLKAAEDQKTGHLILRLYNPTGQTLAGKIQFKFKLQQVWQVTLEEKFIQKIPQVDPCQIEIEIPPKKIVTFKLICRS
ncbi:glycosyl hydrolase-related protein, partial [candidate division KSB1 bacterium]|nr:glycosyl hydrolase-related protein [candidate division KSB1 bacterium]